MSSWCCVYIIFPIPWCKPLLFQSNKDRKHLLIVLWGQPKARLHGRWALPVSTGRRLCGGRLPGLCWPPALLPRPCGLHARSLCSPWTSTLPVARSVWWQRCCFLWLPLCAECSSIWSLSITKINVLIDIENVSPTCLKGKQQERQYYKCYKKKSSDSIWDVHWVGSCPIPKVSLESHWALVGGGPSKTIGLFLSQSPYSKIWWCHSMPFNKFYYWIDFYSEGKRGLEGWFRRWASWQFSGIRRGEKFKTPGVKRQEVRQVQRSSRR